MVTQEVQDVEITIDTSITEPCMWKDCLSSQGIITRVSRNVTLVQQ